MSHLRGQAMNEQMNKQHGKIWISSLWTRRFVVHAVASGGAGFRCHISSHRKFGLKNVPLDIQSETSRGTNSSHHCGFSNCRNGYSSHISVVIKKLDESTFRSTATVGLYSTRIIS